MYFDQLVSMSKHLSNIEHDIKSNITEPISSKIDNTSHQTKKYYQKMPHAVATHGTIQAAKAILHKTNKVSQNRHNAETKETAGMEPMAE